MTNELLHFSAHPIERINPVAKGNRGGGDDPTHKPEGFWVSVGASWPEWCKAESFATDRFQFVTRVELRDDANVRWIRTVDEIDLFHSEFRSAGVARDWQRNHIHWDRVAEFYDGIIIAPYLWSRRLDGPASEWYYSWDCASGCLWDPRCIASIECVELPDLSAILPEKGELFADDEQEAAA